MSINNRPYVLSIAGLDPSAGAGLFADVKTIENLHCYGLGVNTANTVQNDIEFKACHWLEEELIIDQVEVLIERFPVEVVKIGIVENLLVLDHLLERLHNHKKELKIIWDPVLRSGSGYTFQEAAQFDQHLSAVLEKVFMVTPNFDEFKMFYPGMAMEDKIKEMSGKTNLYLKGGHRPENVGLDELFTNNGDYFQFSPVRKDCSEKHGSGCVLSSAIAAHLALGHPIEKAVEKAKHYTENFLASNTALLGYHKV